MLGFGLLKGLTITLKKFMQKKVTQMYPEEMPILPSRSLQSFAFYPEKCISCEICAKACPNSVIKVEYHKNEKGKKVLDNYRMSLSYCMFCGLCIESCPTAAINSDRNFKLSYVDKSKGTIGWKGITKETDGTLSNI